MHTSFGGLQNPGARWMNCLEGGEISLYAFKEKVWVVKMQLCKVLAIILLSVVFSSACAGLGGGQQDTPLPIPDATTSITPADLRIGPMDMLEIEIFGVDDLGGAYQVDFAGDLKLPLIGQFQVAGMTASELSYQLEEKFGDRYLQDPDISVTIAESVGRRVTVDGSVRNPGLYDFTGDLTLIQAVALAGGPGEGSNPRKVVVFRQIGGDRHAAAFDLISIRNGNSEDPRIYGNDIIIMDGSAARAAYGDLLDSVRLIALFMAF